MRKLNSLNQRLKANQKGFGYSKFFGTSLFLYPLKRSEKPLVFWVSERDQGHEMG